MRWVAMGVLFVVGSCVAVGNGQGGVGALAVLIGVAMIAKPFFGRIDAWPRGAKGVLFGSVGLLALASLIVGSSVESNQQAAAEDLRVAEAKVEEERVAFNEAKRREAAAALPPKREALVRRFTETWARVEDKGHKLDIDVLQKDVAEVLSETSALIAVAGRGADAELDSLHETAAARAGEIASLREAQRLPFAVEVVEDEARKALKDDQLDRAVQVCDAALGKIANIASFAGTWAEPHAPSKRALQQRTAAITRLRDQAAKKRDAKLARERRESEKYAKLLAKCGEAPPLSGWDGELLGLESQLARAAHDPDSIDVENCTEPLLYDDRCWVSTCDVRGKNAFGALVLNRMKFSCVHGIFVKLGR